MGASGRTGGRERVAWGWGEGEAAALGYAPGGWGYWPFSWPGQTILLAESEPQVKVNWVLLAVCLAASCCRRLTFSLPGGGGVAFALAMAVEMMPLCSGGPRKQIVSARTLLVVKTYQFPR